MAYLPTSNQAPKVGNMCLLRTNRGFSLLHIQNSLKYTRGRFKKFFAIALSSSTEIHQITIMDGTWKALVGYMMLTKKSMYMVRISSLCLNLFVFPETT